MQMQLTGGSGLSDGSANFNAAATAALSIWNQSPEPRALLGDHRGTGDAATATAQPGVLRLHLLRHQVPPGDTLASRRVGRWTARSASKPTSSSTAPSTGTRIAATSAASGVWDIRRVALHEFGHALGLDHPDEHGQSVDALMNSILGNLDSLTADDIAGAQSMYGAGHGRQHQFPAAQRAERLLQLSCSPSIATELRAAPSATYVDPEGAVIWLTEYARQRVGQCSHAAATTNTLNQITSERRHAGVRAARRRAPIPFPPRNEGLLFMNQLDNTYRDALRRSLGSSFVNNEGAVVWVLEYLRYRLNGCNHGDATTKVLQQIRGQGIQPVCTLRCGLEAGLEMELSSP